MNGNAIPTLAEVNDALATAENDCPGMMGARTARAVLHELTELARLFPDFPHTKACRRLLKDLPYIVAYDDGRKTLSAVGKEFGCSKQNVSVILRRHGIRLEERAQRIAKAIDAMRERLRTKESANG